MTATRTKSNGIHYTPPDLARFLARMTLTGFERKGRCIEILDPACGDGGLLESIAVALPASQRRDLKLSGYETDSAALVHANRRLARIGVKSVTLKNIDFLSIDGVQHEGPNGQRRLF